MKILVCPDKFRGSLSASEACVAIQKGLHDVDPDIVVVLAPMADGGEGSLEAISQSMNLKHRTCLAHDALMRKIEAIYAICDDVAYIESAKVIGLSMLEVEERNPMHTTSFGLGEVIADAIQHGTREIVLFAGGSATNDGGIGMATVLGYKFIDKDGESVQPGGGKLLDIAKIVSPMENPLHKIEVKILCDVDNTFFGEFGATKVYGSQKGASKEDIQVLEEGMMHLASIIKRDLGKDIAQMPRGGAAGGIGGGSFAFLNAELHSGSTEIIRMIGLEQKIQEADYVISGEGSLDAQSLQGKVISILATMCQKADKKLVLFCGRSTLNEEEIASLNVFYLNTILGHAKDEADAVSNASGLLQGVAGKWVKGFLS